MHKVKILTLLGIVGLIPFYVFANDKTEVFRIEVIRRGIETRISSDGLDLTACFQKPVSVPQSDETGKWKIISGETVVQRFSGINGQLNRVSWTFNTGQVDCETWISDKKELVAFRQTFTNKTQKPVKLSALHPMFIDGKRSFSFGNTSDWLILEQFRHKNDLPKSETPVAGKSVSCDPFFIINNNRGSGKNLLIGCQTACLHLSEISVSFADDLQLDNISANCDFEGVEVPPGGSRTSQWFIISLGSDADLLIDGFTERLRNYCNLGKPRGNSPSVYCTWYYHADNYNEDIFKGDIAQFKKEHLPFDVFLIDECWDVNKWGDFEANESFPGGMKRVAQEINSAGYIPGIWLAPFLADHESQLVKNHPEWLLKNSKGRYCTFNMNERDHLILDLTYPGVCEYLEDQFRKISDDWGYRYFKFDFMRAVFLDTDQQFYDKTATSLEAYRKGLEAIRRGVGPDAYISVCGGHYGASLGIADSQRSGSDVKSFWNEKELPKYRQNILRTWMADLWHVDPDAMMVRRQEKALPSDRRNLTTGLFTDDEAFTNTLNQFIGGNLVTFTEDFAVIDPDRKMLYKYVIPSVNSASKPVDMFNTKIPEIMVTHIEPVAKDLPAWNMVSVVNWSDTPKDYLQKLNSTITGKTSSAKFIVYDFQRAEIRAIMGKGETLSVKGVKGHQSKLLKILPWDGVSPVFVGTDLSFSCGGIEIAGIHYDTSGISGVLDTPWFVPVELTFLIPENGTFEKRVLHLSPGQRRFSLPYE